MKTKLSWKMIKSKPKAKPVKAPPPKPKEEPRKVKPKPEPVKPREEPVPEKEAPPVHRVHVHHIPRRKT